MTQYIDKDALVAKIENWKQHTLKCGYPGQGIYEEGNLQGRLDACKKILSFINTLEVKEVDLEEEIDNYFNTSVRKNILANDNATLFMQIRKTAKYFFELGLKTQKGE